MLAYFAWALLLTVHRSLVINSEVADKNVIGDGDAYIDGEGENFDEAHNVEVRSRLKSYTSNYNTYI